MNQQEQHYLVNNTRLNIRLIEENATELIPLIGKHPELFQAVCRIMDANRAPKIVVPTMSSPISFETAGPVTATNPMNHAQTTAAAMSTTPKAPRKRTVKATSPTIADLAAANVAHETAVIAEVASLGDMTWSDAQGFVDFGGFDYMQCLTKGLTPAETAKVLLAASAPAPIAEAPHQIGQPITHAPTIAALAELVTQATAQVEQEAQTSPAAPEIVTNEAPARYYIWGGSGRYHINDSLAATLTEVRISKRGWNPDPQGQELAAAACRKLNAAEGREALSYQQQAVMLTPTLTSPVTVEVPAEMPAAPDDILLHWPQTTAASPFYDEDEAGADVFNDVLPGRTAIYIRYTNGLRWPCRTVRNDSEHAEKCLAAWAQRGVLKDYRKQPATPAPVLTPPQPMSKRKFPFTALRLAGHAVRMLHQIGKCAVAKVTTFDHNPRCFYALRYRQHTIDCAHFDLIPQALELLRRKDNAEIRRDNEVFTVTDALEQLDLSPPCLDRFCAHHGLDVDRSYKRRELRRAITDKREPKMPVYLSLLNKLTVTTPATK